MVDTGFDAKDLKMRLYVAFGPDSDYEREDGPSVKKEDMPIDGPWRPGHITAFVANFEENMEITGNDKGANVSVISDSVG